MQETQQLIKDLEARVSLLVGAIQAADALARAVKRGKDPEMALILYMEWRRKL
jgi:hypothetical protein